MSRRRPTYAEAGPQAPSSPIAVVWAEPPRTPAGDCPKCGKHIGRAVWVHAKTCEGKPE